jgi:hypothetical protein
MKNSTNILYTFYRRLPRQDEQTGGRLLLLLGWRVIPAVGKFDIARRAGGSGARVELLPLVITIRRDYEYF